VFTAKTQQEKAVPHGVALLEDFAPLALGGQAKMKIKNP